MTFRKLANRLLLSFLLLCFLTSSGRAQDQFGGHAPGLKWQMLSSDVIRVIYPEGMDQDAQRIANIINYMAKNNRASIGDLENRVDIVLQNQTVIPNGYVGLAPFRSEFFATPPQGTAFLGSLNWLDVLTIHEYRHVQQISNSNRGLSKFFRILTGEGGWSVFNFLAIPNWYSEGDAVIIETALTNGGRGRAPFFTKEQRALALAGKDFEYTKHRNRSFKSLLPNHYPLGHLILNQVKKDHGNEVTGKIMQEAAAYKGLFYPFGQSMKRHTGKNVPQMYHHAWEENKKTWAEQLQQTNLRPTTALTAKPKRTVTNYRFPHYLDDGSIIALKNSYKKTDRLIQIKDGKEKVLTSIGIHIEPYISHGNGLVAWTELGRNARRGYQSFSNIVLYNMTTGKKRKLTKKSKYFSPVVSPDGKTVAAIHISPNQKNRLVLLNSNTGVEERSFPNPENYNLARPSWSADGQELVLVAKHNSQLTLMKVDLSENTQTMLLSWTSHVLDVPRVHKDKVFFSAAFSGIDNIYYTHLNGSKEIHQVSSVPIGAFEPTFKADGSTVLFAEFTDMGYQLSEQVFNDAYPVLLQFKEPSQQAIFETMATKSEGGNILDRVPTEIFESKKYNGLFRGLKFHSWSITPSVATPALAIQMNNMLNDVAIIAGGGINRNEGNSNFYNASVSIARWVPVVTLIASQSERSTDFYNLGADTLANKDFNESLFGANVSLPLQWYHGNFVTSFTSSLGYNYRNQSNVRTETIDFKDRDFGSYNTAVSFSTIRRRARQNVGTRLGLRLGLGFIQNTDDLSNEKINTNATIFLPGLMANHRIKLSGRYQKELLTNPYQYADAFAYPRGYSAPINDEFQMFSADYALPLLYPDFGIGPVTYFQRIRTNLFYDAGRGRNEELNQDFTYRSYGFEVIFDNTFFNLALLSIGVRQSYLLDDDLMDLDRKTNFSFFATTEF